MSKRVMIPVSSLPLRDQDRVIPTGEQPRDVGQGRCRLVTVGKGASMCSRMGWPKTSRFSNASCMRVDSVTAPMQSPLMDDGQLGVARAIHRGQHLAHDLLGVGGYQASPSRCGHVTRSPARPSIREEEPVLLHPLVTVDLGEIALAGVTQDGHDAGVGVVDLLGDLQRGDDVQAGGAAHEEAILSREPARHASLQSRAGCSRA